MLGIIFAMPEEGELFNSHLEIKDTVNIAKLTFIKGSFASKELITVISGIGKVNAAIATQILISEFNVSSIVLVGLAGSLNPSLNRGDIVLGVNYAYNDFDLTPFGYQFGEVPNLDKLTSNAKLLGQFLEVLQRHSEYNYIIGDIVSGDSFISSEIKKNDILSKLKADCTEMEGAAVAHVASLNEIPFIVVRCISDNGDDDAVESFNSFIKETTEKLTIILEDFVSNMEV